MNAIEINSLSKHFKDSVAVDNISLNVEEGEIFGFLGPNGAGKSTTMMILTTLLKPTSGHASVCGYDVVSNSSQVRKNIGFVQQEIGIDEYLTARENLQFQCKISQIPKDQIQERIDEVIDLVELTEKQKKYYKEMATKARTYKNRPYQEQMARGLGDSFIKAVDAVQKKEREERKEKLKHVKVKFGLLSPSFYHTQKRKEIKEPQEKNNRKNDAN